MAVDVLTETVIARPRDCRTPTRVGKLVAPMMAAAMKRANTADLAQLKALLERATTAA